MWNEKHTLGHPLWVLSLITINIGMQRYGTHKGCPYGYCILLHLHPLGMVDSALRSE